MLARQRESYAELASQHATLEAQCISAARLIGHPTNGDLVDEGGSASGSGGQRSGPIDSVRDALGVLRDAGGVVADLARAERRLAVAAGASLRHAAAEKVAAATGIVACDATQAQHAEQLLALRAELRRVREGRSDAVAEALRAKEEERSAERSAERAAAGEVALERDVVAHREKARSYEGELAAARASEARGAAAEAGALQRASATHREEISHLRHECATSQLALQDAARAASAQEARAATALAVAAERWSSECATSSAALEAARHAHDAALREAERGVHLNASPEKLFEAELGAIKTHFEDDLVVVMESDAANAAALEAARGALRRRDETAARVAADALSHYELECDASRQQAAAASAEIAALVAQLAQSTPRSHAGGAANAAVASESAGASSEDAASSPSPQLPPATLPVTVAAAVSQIEEASALSTALSSVSAARLVTARTEVAKAKKKRKKKKKKK